MKNVIAKFLLVLFLFGALVPAQAKEELAKLPGLLEHFKEHQAETPGIGFFQFWKMHYGEGFAQHQTDHDHSKLPGKEHCDHLHAPILVAFQHLQIHSPALPTIGEASRPVFQDQSYDFSLPSDIWQPPRAI
ncbi:MAG: hypothetical protein MUC59_01625 [Saprospiraceae bacterium]|jgi:hypothetical protein|nr:hypothetical protein [Saprospiraceae bacterium]